MGLASTDSITSPVTTAEAKTHMRIAGSDDDTYIAGLLVAATDYAMTVQRRELVQRSLTWTMDFFPSHVLDVPRSPLVSVTSIQYINSTGGTSTIASTDYDVDTTTEPGRISPAFNESWPTPRKVLNAITIKHEVGYSTDASSVPETTKQAIKILTEHWYEAREPIVMGATVAEVPMSVQSLLTTNALTEIP